jgi:hypothetical protein
MERGRHDGVPGRDAVVAELEICRGDHVPVNAMPNSVPVPAARQTVVTALRVLRSQRHIERDSVPTGDPVAQVLVELTVERH